MASHKVCTYNDGFTLVEVLIVMGMLGMLAGAVSFIDINSFRGDAFRAEVSSLGVILQTARANAFNNINQSRHGVAISPPGCNGYLLYEGDNYATANHTLDACIEAQYGVTFSPASPTEVVFVQLSGDAVTAGGGPLDADITVNDPNRSVSTTITLNHEGRISW